MPWKLLAFILIIAVVLTFVGFNLGNSSDISLVFYAFKDVPVVITILASFLFGLLVAFFFTLGKHTGKNSLKAPRQPALAANASASIPPVETGAGEPFKPDPVPAKPKVATRKSRAKNPDTP